jgi:hypothetical protein
MKPLPRCLLIGLAFASAAWPTAGRGHESPIDHVERELRLSAEDGQVQLVYRLLPTERATLMELRAMDADGDGTVSEQERDAFFAGKAHAIARLIELRIGDRPLPLAAVGSVRCDPQLGQTFLFAAALPALPAGRHPGTLVDGHSRDYPGGYVWKEPGQGGSGGVRIEPVPSGNASGSRDHPPWLELQFEAVVR